MKRQLIKLVVALGLAASLPACDQLFPVVTPAGSSLPQTESTAPPDGLQITGTWWFEKNLEDGYLITVGTIRNLSSLPAWGVIRLEYLDANEDPIPVNTMGEAALYDRDVSMIPIPGGGTGYFKRTTPLTTINGKVAQVNTIMMSAEYLESAPRPEISQFNWDDSSDWLTLTGLVKNAGNEPCPNPELWAVFYQADQLVDINPNNWFDTVSLSPGQEMDFEFIVFTVPEKYDQVIPVVNCPQ